MNAGQQRLAVAAELAKEKEREKKPKCLQYCMLINVRYLFCFFPESFAILTNSFDRERKTNAATLAPSNLFHSYPSTDR